MTGTRGKKLKQVIDPTIAKAFTHPLRGHVWVTLFERGVVSPTEVAAELDIEVSEVSYHFRKLLKKKLIRLVRTEQRRGFDEHYYEPVAPALDFDDDEWMELPEEIRSTLSGEALKQIIEGFTSALEAGSFDAPDRHLSQSWISVDERGWRELMRVAKRALKQILAIQERCAKRSDLTAEQAIQVSVVLACFETAASVLQREPEELEEDQAG